MSLLPSGAIETGGYNINNSVRLRRSASAYLQRTSSHSTQTYTYSFWMKKGPSNVSAEYIFGYYNGAGSSAGFRITSDQLEWYSYALGMNAQVLTTQVFRDPSAWYHVVGVMDTTNATSTERIRLYINGVRVTAGTFTYPSLNFNTYMGNNLAWAWGISGGSTSGSTYFDGYLTEINVIDGQALNASYFGETNTTTGSWIPKKYTGTYGTGGYYLKFSDIATTSGSNAGLGKDFSGNTNYWTTNNISVTAGTTYDAMTDSPTNTSATVANYAVLNPLQVASATLSNANLSMARSGAGYGESSSTFSPEGNKGYFEITRSSTGDHLAGFILNSISPSTNNYTASGSYWYQCDTGSVKYGTGGSTATLITGCTSAPTGSQIIMVAFDFTGGNRNVWFGLQGTWGVNASSQTGVPSTGAFPHLTTTQLTDVCRLYFSSGDANTFSINFGQRPFAYTPPTGFVALNTFNLPTPTILQGNKYMDATLYTGSTGSVTVTNAAGFKPDMVWMKARSGGVTNHALVDSVRPSGYALYPNITDAEANNSTLFTGITSTGFTLAGNNATYSGNGYTYVGWQWQAGQGSTSSNTSGSITSTVSVNTTAGFSVVTYTGTGANATVGHGLGVAPKMVIVKRRNSTSNWSVLHTSISGSPDKFLYLNSTSAVIDAGVVFNGSNPSSTVFSVGTDATVNASGGTYVAYCFAEIAGFSRFGSYTGNGNADGPFVFTNFRPKYVMIKRTDGVGPWYVLDSVRNTYNVMNLYVEAQDTAAEATFTFWDFVSNGFKLRTSTTNINGSSQSFIYMAFAENPTKYALAR